jgi:copper chaperone CopZ
VPDTVRLEIEGMSCNHCVQRVTKTLDALPGVRVKTVAIGSAEVEVEPGAASPEHIARAIDDIGFPARTARGVP